MIESQASENKKMVLQENEYVKRQLAQTIKDGRTTSGVQIQAVQDSVNNNAKAIKEFREEIDITVKSMLDHMVTNKAFEQRIKELDFNLKTKVLSIKSESG